MKWDAASYHERHAYDHSPGEELIALLSPRANERILDLGCGTARHTHRISQSGARVVGLDRSPEMIAYARQQYPELELVEGDAGDFSFEEPFDAIYSHLALHWVSPPGAPIRCIATALRPGGRLVAELAGKDNCRSVLAALVTAREVFGYGWNAPMPFYQPSVGQYATLIEAHGLRTDLAELTSRMTPLHGGKEGLRRWLHLFGEPFFLELPAEAVSAVISFVEQRLAATLFDGAVWHLDHVRLRIVARKEAS